MRRLTLAATVAGAMALALLCSIALPATAKTAAVALPANCDRQRTAVAFHPGAATPISRPGTKPPVPCGTSTGFPAVESRVAAGAAGLVFSPATADDGSVGVAYSTDQGATWHQYGTTGGIDDNLDVDKATGRIFWLVFKGDGNDPQYRVNHEIQYTDTLVGPTGPAWMHSSTGACCVEGENSRAVTSGGVEYVCSDTSLVGGVVYPLGARVCSASTDRGATFGPPHLLFSKPVPQHSECAPFGGEYFAASEGAYPETGPGGSLVVLVHCGTDQVAVTYLATSTDQGVSWQLLQASACQPGATGPQSIPNAQELRTDAAGNLYAGSTSTSFIGGAITYDDTPVLQVSTDGGCNWTAPMAVTPPGVVAHSHHPEDNAFTTGLKAPHWPEPFSDYSWFMDVREPGHVAFDFYGTTDMTGAHWDAYVSESRNALDADPTFWAAPVNLPSKNMRDGAYADEDSSGNEHIGLSIGPDGSPWGSFTDGTNGFAGRLAWRS